MENFEPEFQDWQFRLVRARAKRLEEFTSFIEMLATRDMFDAAAFRSFRQRSKSQADWANMIGVAQGTIGNWERGLTYPNKTFRQAILAASKEVFKEEEEKARRISEYLSVKVDFDPEDAQGKMNESILRAALTDFDYDQKTGKIISVPFPADETDPDSKSFKEDRDFLLEALSAQADMICIGLESGANAETDYLIRYLTSYRNQCEAERVNPRLIYRLGDTIYKRASTEDVRSAISDWDDQAFDGFIADHHELMRLYYREALAKAQEVEAAHIEDDSTQDYAVTFSQTADLLDSAKNEDGTSVYDGDITAILRDIAKEISDISETIRYTMNERRRDILHKRRREAIKNGSIFVGRVLFFSSIFIVMVAPPTLGAVGSIASILGLIEAAVPGTVLALYERCRSAMPILPRL